MWGDQSIENWWPFLVFLAATAMLFIRLRLKRSLQKVDSREEGLERLKETNRRKSLEGMLVEIHDINRELTARVDNKLTLVTALAQDLQKAQQTAQHTAQQQRPQGEDSARLSQIEARLADIEKRLGALEERSARPVVPDDPQIRNTHQKNHAEIFDLFKRGLSALEIAEKVGRQRGEIELILGLGGLDARTNERA